MRLWIGFSGLVTGALCGAFASSLASCESPCRYDPPVLRTYTITDSPERPELIGGEIEIYGGREGHEDSGELLAVRYHDDGQTIRITYTIGGYIPQYPIKDK